MPRPLLWAFLLVWAANGCSPGHKEGGGSPAEENSARITSQANRLNAREGGTAVAGILLKNTGSKEWSSLGRNPCFVSYHLLGKTGNAIKFENARTPLPRTVLPGEEVGVSIRIKAPLDKGDYLVEVDLLREGLAWFKDSGSRTLVIPLLVEERARRDETSFASSVPEFNGLQKLIRATLESDEVAFEGKTGRIHGFTAGAGYPQVWLRDEATIIPASRFYYPQAYLTSWLEEHLAFQKSDGGLEDWIDGRGRSDKNTVETDQEASAVQSAYQVFLIKGPEWLEKPISGLTVLERLEKAVGYLFENRFDREHGLITGAHTADWGDVDPEDPDQKAIYVDGRTHWTADIYDQSMVYEACRHLASMFASLKKRQRADGWLKKAASLREATDRYLWQENKGFYRVHIHLDPFPHDFDEDDMFAMGGNVQAVLAGLADARKAERIIQAAIERQRSFGLSTISGSLLPPYPAGFFQHPAMDEPYEYQNGGQWDWFGGRLVLAMFENGFSSEAREKLIEIAAKDIRNGGLFEWDTKEGNGRGSDDYAGSAGSLARALYEGYAGFKLGERSLDLEPKFGADEGRVRFHIPSSGLVAEIDYRPVLAGRRILIRYESNFAGQGKVRVLIPWAYLGVHDAGSGRIRLEVRRDGHEIPFLIEKRGQDEFVAVTTDFGGHTLEIGLREPPG